MQPEERIKYTSKKHFGFFSSRPSRMAEYRWVIEELNEGGYICDIGAGRSPVPIILAEDGNIVETFDGGLPSNNEWGFVDYSLINKKIESHNMHYMRLHDFAHFDAIYSISVIEHMRAADRRSLFGEVANDLVDGGLFLVTMDVRQRTDEIHNRNYEKTIEDNHGTIMDVVDELHDAGFMAVLHWVEEFIGQGQDVLFIKAVK